MSLLDKHITIHPPEDFDYCNLVLESKGYLKGTEGAMATPIGQIWAQGWEKTTVDKDKFVKVLIGRIPISKQRTLKMCYFYIRHEGKWRSIVVPNHNYKSLDDLFKDIDRFFVDSIQ